MSGEKRLLTTQEVWQIIGKDRVGRTAVYRIMRRYGLRLGKSYLLPAHKLEALLEGDLERLEDEKTPRLAARG